MMKSQETVEFYRAPRKRIHHQPLWLIYGFVFPAVALALVFDYYPALSGLYLSLTNSMMVGIPSQFIGLQNYEALFTNPIFQASLWHMVILALATIAIGTIVPPNLNDHHPRNKHF